VVSEERSFFNGGFLPQAAQVDLERNAQGAIETASWSNHVAYLGLTAQDKDNRDVGAVYRLQMADANGAPLPVDSWGMARFYATDKPVTGAVNSAYDSLGNLWVVFGSGRVWFSGDQIPCGTDPNRADQEFKDCCENHEQYFYGLKEPVNSSGFLTFEEVGVGSDARILDVSGIAVYGRQGILAKAGENASHPLSLNPLIAEFSALYTNLSRHLMDRDATGAPLARGYKCKMENWRIVPAGWREDPKLGFIPIFESPGATRFEVITTQPQIDGLPNGRSNTVFTSYVTKDSICDPLGNSNLNVVDTFTGLPHPDFLDYVGFTDGGLMTIAGSSGSSEPISQATGVRTAGKGMASEAWILKTGEGTVYGNTSFNSNRNRIFVPAALSDRSGIVSWREVLDMGDILNMGEIPAAELFKDLVK
jgi:hypothetical protein